MKHAWLFAALVVGAASFPAAAQQPAAAFQLEETTIARIHAAMKAGQLTCRGLVEQYLKRIEAYDKAGPAINAIVARQPDCPREADDLDRRAKQGGFVGRSTAFRPSSRTTSRPSACRAPPVRSRSRASSRPATPSRSSASRRPARSSSPSRTWPSWRSRPYETVSSILPGYTKNPYALDRVTAGSSGGTAAAVAANFGAIGLGSDTGNSIRGPASHQALAGIRSTMGLTSRAGRRPTQPARGHRRPDDAHARGRRRRAAGRSPVRIPTIPSRSRTRDRPRLQPRRTPRDDPELSRVAPEGRPQGHAHRHPAPGLRARHDRCGDRQGLHDRGRRPEARRRHHRRSGARRPRSSPAAARRGHVRRLQVRHQPLAGVTRRQRPGEERSRRSSSRDSSIRPCSAASSRRRKGTENGPDTPACKAESEYRGQVRAAVAQDDGRERRWTRSSIRRGATRRASSATSTRRTATTASSSRRRPGFPSINVPMGYTRDNTLPAGITFFGRAWDEGGLISLAYSLRAGDTASEGPISRQSVVGDRESQSAISVASESAVPSWLVATDDRD